MNFYKHYIGDFQRDTGHLSLSERGAYLALIHHYYATEKPLPADHAALCRIAGAHTKAECAAVETASGFFETREGRLHHRRIEDEIAKASAQRETNREIGKRGGRPKTAPPKPQPPHAVKTEPKTESVSESAAETVSDPKPNRNPNQTPDSSVVPIGTTAAVAASVDPPPKPEDPPDPPDMLKELFDVGVRMLTSSGRSESSARTFIGRLRQNVGVEEAMRLLMQARSTTDPAAYIVKAATPKPKRVALC
jgi:uncharacterized protein YdaU (DUF1376 family)